MVKPVISSLFACVLLTACGGAPEGPGVCKNGENRAKPTENLSTGNQTVQTDVVPQSVKETTPGDCNTNGANAAGWVMSVEGGGATSD